MRRDKVLEARVRAQRIEAGPETDRRVAAAIASDLSEIAWYLRNAMQEMALV